MGGHNYMKLVEIDLGYKELNRLHMAHPSAAHVHVHTHTFMCIVICAYM